MDEKTETVNQSALDVSNRDINKTNNASNRSTPLPGPTSTQIKKLTNRNVDDFQLMMNKETEKEIMKQNKNP